jgi:hypothetical protein
MKNFILNSAIITGLIFISSCGFHSGYMSNSASLSSANFSYTKMNVKGTSQVDYILCFGGLSKTNLVNAAKQNLLSNNPLESNQALVNTTVNFKKETYLGLYSKVTCMVAGDIVTFNK